MPVDIRIFCKSRGENGSRATRPGRPMARSPEEAYHDEVIRG
jgi:hypothetical protein